MEGHFENDSRVSPVESFQHAKAMKTVKILFEVSEVALGLDGKKMSRHDYKPISVQHEGKFPNHETVLFSLKDPDWVIHRASNRCRTEHPHNITECKEFESGD